MIQKYLTDLVTSSIKYRNIKFYEKENENELKIKVQFLIDEITKDKNILNNIGNLSFVLNENKLLNFSTLIYQENDSFFL